MVNKNVISCLLKDGKEIRINFRNFLTHNPSKHMSMLDIIIPGTNTSTDTGPNKIPAGEKVLVIKTPKGVYIRTNQGKIFAVRTTPKDTTSSTVSSTLSSSMTTVARNSQGSVTVLTNSSMSLGVTTSTTGQCKSPATCCL